MTKLQTVNYIKREIEKLNKKIDLLILTGKSYKKEAQQHLKLVTALNKIS